MSARILIVDDEEIVIRSCLRILDGDEFQVESVRDGREALSKVEENSYDVMILDVMMPNIDGLEVLRRVKETHPNVDVIMITGLSQIDTAVQACVPHYGVYDFTAESGSRSSRYRLERLLRRYVMAADATYPDDYRAASPLYCVRPDAPPFLVLHGSNDTLVPVGEALAFVARLREVSKSPVAYAEIRGAQHAFDIFPSVRSVHVQELPGGVAEVFATVRRGERWGAVALRLQHTAGRWQCTAVEGA